MPPAARDFRSDFFFATTSATVALFVLSALPLGLFVKALKPVGMLAYRGAWLAAGLGHGFRAVITLAPKLPKEHTLAAAKAAVPGLLRDAYSSASVLYLLYCALFFATKFTGAALLPVAAGAAAQALTLAVKKPALVARFPALATAMDLLQAHLDEFGVVVASGVIWVSLTLVLSLLRGPREPLKLAFFVAVLLRGFYACDDSVMFRIKLPRSAGAYHELAWAGVAQKAAPLLTRLPAGAQPYRVAAEEWFGAVKAARKAGKVQ